MNSNLVKRLVPYKDVQRQGSSFSDSWATTAHQSGASQPALEAKLKPLTVYHGRITCQICFISCDKRHLKRNSFQSIHDVDRFKELAEFWQEKDHEYNKVIHLVNWKDSTEKWAHKSCKGMFYKLDYLERQHEKEKAHKEPVLAVTEAPVAMLKNIPDQRKSLRNKQKYESSWTVESQKRCIICNKDIFSKGKLQPPQTISIVDKAEDTLKEFAELHIRNNNEKYVEASKRILLVLSTKSLLAANVAYHRKECYQPFRANGWKRQKSSDTSVGNYEASKNNEAWDSLCQFVKYSILIKKEVYTVAQLRCMYNELQKDFEDKVTKSRNIDIKTKLKLCFDEDLTFLASNKESKGPEYVVSSDVSLSYDVIKAYASGNGIPKYVTIKTTAQLLSNSIRDNLQTTFNWPPTPQDIIEESSDVDIDLYNLLAWIIFPRGQIGKNGRVELPKTKAEKVSQLAQNVISLMPYASPSMDQILLSLTMHRKTGSSTVIDTLHSLGHGISYTETSFIEDKWAEWTRESSEMIPSNIKKGVDTTMVSDNIDWENKSLSGSSNETHHTNCILVQHNDIRNPTVSSSHLRSPVMLHANYNFDRKSHHSFKAIEYQLPPNTSWKKTEPIKFQQIEMKEEKVEITRSSERTLLWVVARHYSAQSGQKLPAWTGFNVLTHDKPSSKVTIGFMPAIPAPPTQKNVIEEIMKRAMVCKKELELQYIFLEVDQAIYHKVLQVLFHTKKMGSKEYDKLIVRMGGFHIIICMLRSIYSRFFDSGLIELLSESGVGSLGSIKSAMKGSDVKFGVRCYKILFEAIMRTKLEYLAKNDPIRFEALYADNDFKTLIESPNQEKVSAILNKRIMEIFPPLDGDMSLWLDSFLSMVDLLMNLIYFQRAGNWEGYLETIYEFLPWCFALNRHNYARDLSYYYADMIDLKGRLPQAYKYLAGGGFSGSMTGNKFTCIPMDQMIEMTINRSSKEVGGLSGITENLGASERWARINHILAALKLHLDEKTKLGQGWKHVELGALRIAKDEEHVERVASGLIVWVPDIWKNSQQLVNISSGEIAPDEMKHNVLNAHQHGKRAFKDFLNRFTEDSENGQNNLKYYDPIKRRKIETFSSQNKKSKNKQSIPKDECESLGNIVAQFDQQTLDLKLLLRWPITSKPWSICSEYSTKRSNAKSLFRNNLQLLSPIPATNNVPPDINMCIVDAMRVVRMIPVTNCSTFLEWAKQVLNYFKFLPGKVIHIIFDVYGGDSTNSLSKGRATKSRARKIEDLSQKLPKPSDWPDFLTNNENKHRITILLADYFLASVQELGKDLYITKGEDCYYTSLYGSNTIRVATQLKSLQRETDTRIAIHVKIVLTIF